jgi:hypothetical protein
MKPILKYLAVATALALSTLAIHLAADAQGLPGGMRRGAA